MGNTTSTNANSASVSVEADDDKYDRLLRKGMRYFENNNFERALTTFQRAARIKVHTPIINFFLGVTLLHLHRLDEAFQAAQTYHNSKHNEEKACHLMGVILKQQKKNEAALLYCEQAYKINQLNHEALLDIAYLHGQLKRSNDGLQAINRYLLLKTDNHNAYFLKAVILLDLQRDTEALPCIEQALKTDPNNSFYLYQQGLCLLNLERFKDAISSFETAYKLNPENLNALYFQAKTLFELDNLNAALNTINHYLKQKNNNADAFFLKAKILVEFKTEQQTEEALACLDQAIRINPDSALLKNYKGLVLFTLDRFEEANQCFKDVYQLDSHNLDALLYYAQTLYQLNRLEEALAAITQYLELKSDNDSAYYLMGRIQISQGEYEKASEFFEMAINYNTNNNEYYWRKAICFIILERFEEAAQSLEIAISLKPTAKYLIDAAFAYSNLKQFKKAIALLNQALVLEPENDDALSKMCSIYYFDLCNFKEALNCINKALMLNKSNVSYKIQKVNILSKLKRFAEAHIIIDDILSKKDLEERHNALFEKSLLYQDQNLFDEALNCITEALTLMPENMEYKIYKSNFLSKLQQYSTARETLSEILKNDESNDQIINCLGKVYLEEGQYHQAAKQFITAYTINPTETNYLLDLASAYQSLKKYKDAQIILDKIIEADPQNISACISKASLFCYTNKFMDAFQLYQQLSIRVPFVIQFFEMHNMSLPFLGGLAYFQQKNFDKALQYFDDAAKQTPQNILISNMKCMTLFELNRKIEAYVIAEEMLKNPADRGKGAHLKSILLHLEKKHAQALHTVDEAIQLDKDNMDYQETKIQILIDSKKYDVALELIDHILQNNKNCKWALNKKGLLLLKQNQLEDALQCFELLLQQDPNNIDLLLSIAYTSIRLNDLHTAKQVVNHVLAIDSTNVLALVQQCQLLTMKFQSKEALACINLAIENNRNNSLLYVIKGWILLKTADYINAKLAIEQALQIDKHDKTIFEMLAILVGTQGQDVFPYFQKIESLSSEKPNIIDPVYLDKLRISFMYLYEKLIQQTVISPKNKIMIEVAEAYFHTQNYEKAANIFQNVSNNQLKLTTTQQEHLAISLNKMKSNISHINIPENQQPIVSADRQETPQREENLSINKNSNEKIEQIDQNIKLTNDIMIKIEEKFKQAANDLECFHHFTYEQEQLKKHQFAFDAFNYLLNQLSIVWDIVKDKFRIDTTVKDKRAKLCELQNWYYHDIQPQLISATPKIFIREFERNAEEFASRIALLFDKYYENGKCKEIIWTYKELNEEANRITNYLCEQIKKGLLKKNALIAIYFNNSPETVACILGIMKAGLAFIPLSKEPNVTNARLVEYLDNCNPDLLIVQDELISDGFIHLAKNTFQNKINIKPYHDVKIESAIHNRTDINIDKNQLAYIINSSGSTGNPKSIMIAHRGLYNTARAAIDALHIEINHRIGWFSYPTFDAAILDIMTPLAKGAALVILNHDNGSEIDKLQKELLNKEVNFITLVPTILEQLDTKQLIQLQGIISTGEEGLQSLFDKLLTEDAMRSVINGYGPSELTIATALGIHKKGHELNIGKKPIEGLEWYLLSESDVDNPFPHQPGVCTRNADGEEVGELYVAGNNLGLGYFIAKGRKVPYRNRFRAIPHPTEKGKMLWVYQTGDRFRRKKDGSLVFAGRVDYQFKLNGVLIHPKAIETALKKGVEEGKISAKIQKSIVVEDINRQDGLLRRNLHMALRSPEEISRLLICDIHTYLKYHPYCNVVPSRFSVFKEYPTGKNNKTDRKKLQELAITYIYPGDVFCLKPNSVVSKFVAELWHKYLAIDVNHHQLCLEDNFKDFGGNSLTAIQILAQIRKRYENINININEFLSYPSLRVLSFKIENDIALEPLITPINREKNDFMLNDLQASSIYPVILINSVTGIARNEYQHIINMWNKKNFLCPIFVTESLSLKNPGYMLRSIDKLAEDFIYSLDKQLGGYKGPIKIIGLSAAGILAHCVARELQVRGRSAAVCCIDTRSSTYYQTLSPYQHAKKIIDLMTKMANYLPHSVKFDKVFMEDVINLNDLASFANEDQLSNYWQKFKLKIMTTSDIKLNEEDKETCLKYYATIYNLIQNQLYYTPEKIKHMTLISFSETINDCDNKLLGWDPALDIRLISVDGNHSDVTTNERWVNDILIDNLIDFCKSADVILTQEQNEQMIDPCLNKLKSLYSEKEFNIINNPLESEIKIPFDSGYIPLTIADRKEIPPIKEKADKQHREDKLNQFDSVSRSAELVSLELSKLISSAEPQKIYISGQGGIGKTTFLLSIRNLFIQKIDDAKKPAWLKNFKMVFYVPLRLLREYQSDSSNLKDAQYELARFIFYTLKNEYGVRLPNEINEKNLSKIIAILQYKILWLIDGGDEAWLHFFGSSNTHQTSLIMNLLNQHNVIFTSRSISYPDSIRAGFKEFELFGYSDLRIEEYIKCYLRHKNQSERFLQIVSILKKHKPIWTLSHNPFILLTFCTMITHSKNEDNLIQSVVNCTTLTEVIQNLIEFLLDRYEHKHTNSFDLLFEPENEIEKDCSPYMEFLEKLAFESAETNKIIIPHAMIQNCLKSLNIPVAEQPRFLEKIHAIGLLRWEGKDQRQIKNDACFIHTLIHEFLAARYCIKLLDNQEQKTQFSQIVKKYRYNQNYLIILSFISGLLRNDTVKLQDFFNILVDDLDEEKDDYNHILFMECLEQAKINTEIHQIPQILFMVTDKLSNHVLHLSENISKPLFNEFYTDIINRFPLIMKYIFESNYFYTIFMHWLYLSKDTNSALKYITQETLLVSQQSTEVFVQNYYKTYKSSIESDSFPHKQQTQEKKAKIRNFMSQTLFADKPSTLNINELTISRSSRKTSKGVKQKGNQNLALLNKPVKQTLFAPKKPVLPSQFPNNKQPLMQNPRKQLEASQLNRLNDWLTGDEISVLSDAIHKLDKYKPIQAFLEFSPTVNLHLQHDIHGSLTYILNKKLTDARIPVFAFALNINPHYDEHRNNGHHWVYVIIMQHPNADQKKCLIINSLGNEEYMMPLEMTKQIIMLHYNITDNNIEICNTGTQNDGYNCGVWTLLMLERTLDYLNSVRENCANCTLTELKNNILLPADTNYNEFIANKRTEYTIEYVTHIKNQEHPTLGHK